ncbi:unnamed protein product [Rhizoctonia solani]|uniref:Transmembrane protein n=1 Tax=Rhizoctonia solani TaxID=456999 RepID=A0A8H3DDS2_9AGAM|nr:unnamed protein product [Rhizoctonia solani]
MEARYSKLSDPPHEFKSYHSFDTDVISQDGAGTTWKRPSMVSWFFTVWPLALHCLLSLGAAGLVLLYVQDCHFNVTERTPAVDVVEGKQRAPFNLLQSDVVTILSSIIVVLRCELMAWGTPLIWRVAVFLMERRGLSRRNLRTLLDYGVLVPGAYSSDFSSIIIGLLLLAVIAANFASPILTGSISWVPSNQLARGLSTSPVRFEDIEDGIRTKQKSYYFDPNFAYVRQDFVFKSIGGVGLAWGRDSEPGVLKRVSSTIEALAINSTVENVTLPYFQVHSIQWIQNHDDIPAFRDNRTDAVLEPYSNSSPISGTPLPFGYALLVPNTTTNWSSDPMESTIIRDTRLLAMYYRYDSDTDLKSQALTPSMPPNTYARHIQSYFYAYAWVTFSAGVGRCKEHSCIVSSPSTIRNNTPVDMEPHQLTFQALALAPVVGLHLVGLNTSLPLSWNNIDSYVEAVLVRSYSGAWDALNSRMWTQSAYSAYHPSFPGLLALVDQRRVYAWLGLQLLVTFLGVIFLIIQSNCSKYALVGDTTLTAFYVDTTMIPRSGKDAVYKGEGVLKVEPRGGRLRVKLERPDWDL